MSAFDFRVYPSQVDESAFAVAMPHGTAALTFREYTTARMVSNAMIKLAARYPKAAHMCRSDHAEIWHGDSENERCPLCRALDRIHAAQGELEDALSNLILDNIKEVERNCRNTRIALEAPSESDRSVNPAAR